MGKILCFFFGLVAVTSAFAEEVDEDQPYGRVCVTADFSSGYGEERYFAITMIQVPRTAAPT